MTESVTKITAPEEVSNVITQAFPYILPAPNTIIYDSTASIQSGNIYTTFARAVSVMNQFQGTANLYIRNGSVVPTGASGITVPWTLTVDANGTTIASGFTAPAPISIQGESNCAITLNESGGGVTFEVSDNRSLGVSGCALALGSVGTFADLNGTNRRLDLNDVQVTSGGQALASATTSASQVVCINQTTLVNDIIPAVATLEFDGTSVVGSQHGNTGTGLGLTFNAASPPAIGNVTPNAVYSDLLTMSGPIASSGTLQLTPSITQWTPSNTTGLDVFTYSDYGVTTNATLLVAGQIATSAGDTYRVDVVVQTQQTASGDYVSNTYTAFFRNVGGTLEQDGTTQPGNAGGTTTGKAWPGFTFSVSGQNINLNVQGAAATTIRWKIQAQVTRT